MMANKLAADFLFPLLRAAYVPVHNSFVYELNDKSLYRKLVL